MEVRPGYKLTEVGVIPEDWGASSLLSVAECLDNVRVPLNESQRQRMRGDIPYCGANGVLDYVDDFVIDDDIILMAEDGGYFDEYATRPIAYRMKGKCWVNNHAHILKARPGHDQSFLFYSLVHKNILPFLASGTRAKLNKSEMEKIVVPAPPMEAEQLAIGTALSDVDALLGGLDRLIAKKRDLKQAAMQQLLTGQTRLAGFHGEWEGKRLGDLLTYEQPTKYLVRSSNYSNSNDVPVLTAGKTFVLGYTDETDGVFDNLPVVIFDDFTTATKYVSFPFKAKSSAMKLLKPRDASVNLRLVYEMLQLVEFQLGEHKRHWISEYQELHLTMPGVNEQTAIMNVLADMDAELTVLGARRDKTRDLKQAMTQELLTGRARLVPEGAVHA